MKIIKTTSGESVLVDDEDFDYLNQWKWHISTKRYAGRMTKVNGKRTGMYMHRIIMNPPKGMVVDHINHNRLDNRRSNLRVCTQSFNLANQRIGKRNTSGYKGVTWDKDRKKWVAQTHKAGKHIFIGRYETLKEAIKAHKEAFSKIHSMSL
jgi:HNH endonuclease/AP2 domain